MGSIEADGRAACEGYKMTPTYTDEQIDRALDAFYRERSDRKAMRAAINTLTHLALGVGMAAGRDWMAWDENSPPPQGEYVVYHSRFRIPGEKVWTYRPAANKYWGTDKIKWKHKKGQSLWFNEGNLVAYEGPEFYCALPRYKEALPKGNEHE